MPDGAFNAFDDRSLLDQQLARDVAARLSQAMAIRGKASLAVSGGSTPKGFFAALAGHRLEWSRLTVTLVDDRWVPPSHADSNDRLVHENLLVGEAAAAQFMPLVTSDAHPRDAVAAVTRHIAAVDTIDVVIIGMGTDGHFASLFPDSEALLSGLDLTSGNTVIAVDPPSAPHPRMSMTLPRILDARMLVLHIVGQEKRELLETARERADAQVLPIAAVFSEAHNDVQVYWAP
jgi:6-phosphogluconolactonase